MSITALSKRIAQLEAKARSPEDLMRPRHRIIGHSQVEIEREQAALIAAGKAHTDDVFLHMRIISPGVPWS